MIIGKTPANWKELEIWVGKIFDDMGYDVKIGQTFNRNSAYGAKANVDVWARKPIDDAKSTFTYLFECKHWEEPITQTVVDSFRSVVLDLGANVGYIISKNGFQEGAEDVANGTTIKLLTYAEFEDAFEKQWVEAMCKKVTDINQKIMDYFDESDIVKDSARGLDLLRFLGEFMNIYASFNKDKITYTEYPLKIYKPDGKELKQCNNRKDYFDTLIPILVSSQNKLENKIGKKL